MSLSPSEDLTVIIDALRSAFAPYECDVRLYENDRLLSFLILDARGRILHSAAEIAVVQLLNAEYLRTLIEQVRSRLVSAGHRLNPGP